MSQRNRIIASPVAIDLEARGFSVPDDDDNPNGVWFIRDDAFVSVEIKADGIRGVWGNPLFGTKRGLSVIADRDEPEVWIELLDKLQTFLP